MTSINVSKFLEKLPSDIFNVLLELEKFGKVTLVGGIVRDYLLYEDIGKDIDLELRAGDEESYQKAIQYVDEKYHAEKLKFGIFRFSITGTEIEVSPPRMDVYKELESYGHSDFEVVVDYALEYNESFARRDFTINAIGFELNVENKAVKLIDPYDGKTHLKNKIIHHVSNDFLKDPVRVLRAIRFKLNFGFSYSKVLEKLLEDSDLSKLTSFYICSEFNKCKKKKSFIEEARTFDLPEKFDDLNRLPLEQFSDNDFIDELLIFLVKGKQTPSVLLFDLLGLVKKERKPLVHLNKNWEGLLAINTELEGAREKNLEEAQMKIILATRKIFSSPLDKYLTLLGLGNVTVLLNDMRRVKPEQISKYASENNIEIQHQKFIPIWLSLDN